MKITAITKFKNGTLWGALKRLGWSQKMLAEKSGCTLSRISQIITLKQRPTVEIAKRIHDAIAEAGDYVDILEEWP